MIGLSKIFTSFTTFDLELNILFRYILILPGCTFPMDVFLLSVSLSLSLITYLIAKQSYWLPTHHWNIQLIIVLTNHKSLLNIIDKHMQYSFKTICYQYWSMVPLEICVSCFKSCFVCLYAFQATKIGNCYIKHKTMQNMSCMCYV